MTHRALCTGGFLLFLTVALSAQVPLYLDIAFASGMGGVAHPDTGEWLRDPGTDEELYLPHVAGTVRIYSVGWSRRGVWARLEYDAYDERIYLVVQNLVSDTLLYRSSDAEAGFFGSVHRDNGREMSWTWRVIDALHRPLFEVHSIEFDPGTLHRTYGSSDEALVRIGGREFSVRTSIVPQEGGAREEVVIGREDGGTKVIATFPFRVYPVARAVLLSPFEDRGAVIMQSIEYHTTIDVTSEHYVFGSHFDMGFE